MSRYSIGYRMKFDNVETEEIKEVLMVYLKRFERYEIKITKGLLLSPSKIESLIKVSEKIASGKYSIHLLKDILTVKNDLESTKGFIPLLQKNKISNEVYLITHIPFVNPMKYLKVILNISKLLPSNYILLLENIEIYNGNFEYLRQINNLFCILDMKNIKNVGMCLDIGHLLFGFYEEKIMENDGLTYLEKMSYIISRIKEIHIHDYCKTDHLQLGEGLMDLGIVSNFIFKYNLDVPIIIETTVKEPKEDGIRQIEILDEFLIRHERR